MEGRVGADSGRRCRSQPRQGWQAQGVDVDDETEEGRQAWFRSMWEGGQQGQEDDEEEDDEDEGDAAEDDDFGDDFDDFAEGGEGDEDFGDFDEADDEPAPSQPPPSQLPTTPDILKGLVSSSRTHNMPPPIPFQSRLYPCKK